jgi:hypothetical protein
MAIAGLHIQGPASPSHIMLASSALSATAFRQELCVKFCILEPETLISRAKRSAACHQLETTKGDRYRT